MSPMSSKENPIIFENVAFEQMRDRRGKHIDYVSFLPGYKRIILSPEFSEPEIGKFYRVQVVHDTKPEDPTAGSFVVEIIDRSEFYQV